MAPVTICWTQLGSPRCAHPIWITDIVAAPRIVPGHRPSASGEAAAADDDGSDHVQLEAVGDGRVADRQARELEHARHAGKRRGDRVDGDFRALDRHAAEPRRPLIGTNGEEMTAESRVLKHDRDGERENRNKPDAAGYKNPRPGSSVRSKSFSQVAGASRRRSPERPFAVPRTSNIMPSVTMKGTTLSLVMRRPLMSPQTAPAPIPAAAADIGP